MEGWKIRITGLDALESELVSFWNPFSWFAVLRGFEN
jgi:hypothetical protein